MIKQALAALALFAMGGSAALAQPVPPPGRPADYNQPAGGRPMGGHDMRGDHGPGRPGDGGRSGHGMSGRPDMRHDGNGYRDGRRDDHRGGYRNDGRYGGGRKLTRHQRACAARYPSYDWRTDRYRTRGGSKRCRL